MTAGLGQYSNTVIASLFTWMVLMLCPNLGIAQISDEDREKEATLPPIEAHYLDLPTRKPGLGRVREGLFDRLERIERTFALRRSKILESGSNIRNNVWADDYFMPLREKLAVISTEISDKRKAGLSDAERYELTEHVIERFREIMPSRSVEVFFQLEFISEGPTIYFSRQDVRNDFGITDEQLSELEDIARKRFEEFNNDDSSRRMDVILAMWNELSDDQLEKAELLFGLKTESIFETLYHSVHRNNRTVRFGLGATRDDFYRQHSKNYSELASGLLFGLFVDELEKPRDEPLVTGVDIVLKDFIDPIGIVPDRTSNWLTVENARGQGALPILRNLREILNKSEYPLNKQQEHAYDLMLNGTKETDGLGEYYFGRRLQRKAGPFAESLTAAQRQIAREVIILHIGANRLLMNEPMISKLEVTNEQRKAMLEKSRAAWLAYLEWQRAYKMESYQEMMGVLTKKQQTQFEILVGDPIEKVVFRLRNTAHDAFMMDLDKDIRAKIKR